MTIRINGRMSFCGLLRADLLREHVLTHGEKVHFPTGWKLWLRIFSPRFGPVLLCRISHELYRRRLKPIAKIFSLLNFFAFGIEISVRCSIGPGLFLPHTQGTVIGAWSIGANATIFQGVTLGSKELDFKYSKTSRPILGRNVLVGAGAKVLGGIKIEDDVTIGANSVVLSDVARGCIVVGIPARLISTKYGNDT